MIKYLTHNYINRKKYDLCINLDQSGLFYGYSWYLDSVCSSWDCLVLNDYDAVWPLPVSKKYGIKYFYRPFGIQQLGIYHKKPLDAEILREFTKTLLEHTRFADLFLNEYQEITLENANAHIQAQANFVLPLNRPYSEIFQGYNGNMRRKVKKLRQTKLQLFENDSPDALIELFKQNKGGELKLEEDFYRQMKKAMYKLLHKGMGQVWTVYGGPNEMCAGCFWVRHKGRAVFLFSALNDWGKEYDAMPYLINEFIIYSSEKLDILDFEGSNDPGLARFYSGFGSEERQYYRLFYNNLPLPLKWLKRP